MQPIAPPQGTENPQGYTREEILRVLRGHTGSRTFDFRYHLLDRFNNFKDDISDIVEDGTIDQNWLAPIKRTADFEILGSGDSRIDYLQDRIQPWIRLQMPRKLRDNGVEIDVLWDNTFDAASGTATPENSGDTGDSFSRTAGYVSYDGSGYLNLGSPDGTGSEQFGSGSFSFGTNTRTSFKYTAWVNIPVNGSFNIGIDGNSVDTSRWIQLDDTFDTQFRFGSIDVSDHKSNMLGGDIRIEVVYDGRQTRYAVFWTDPYGGTTPDFTTSEDASDWGSLRLFQLSGGGFNQPPTKLTQFTVQTPRGPELAPRAQQVWSNNFNGPTGAAVDSGSMGQSGNVPDSLGGDLTYVDTWSADSLQSVEMGATEPGWIRARIPQRDNWRFRAYFNIPTGGRLAVSPMNDDTFVSFSTQDPLSVSPMPEPWAVFDDNANVWNVAGIDVSSLKDTLLDSGFRFEMDVFQGTYEWRIYTVDPEGRSPDISWAGEAGDEWTSMKWFAVWGGGDPATPVMMDRMFIGELQPLRVPIPDNENYVEWPQGVFVMSSPTREIDRNGVITRHVEGYDVIQTITNDKLEDRLVLTAGTRYIEVVNQLLGDVPKIVTPSSTEVARDREWGVGYSKRQAINDMLQSINYESISADERGNFIVRPYILPDERTPEFDYLDDQDSVLMPEATQEFDLFEVPNKWILTVSNPELPPMKAVLTNNDPANPTSTVRRGQTIVDFREEEDSPSQASLMRKAQRHAWAASRKFEGVEFSTLMMPFHSGNDCYNIRYNGLGIEEKYLEHYWIIRMRAGERMERRARRVVDFNPHDDTFHMNNVQINGALQAKNMHAGLVTVTPAVNRPTEVVVSGFELSGHGSIHVQVGAHTSVPGNVREVSSQKEGPRSFSIVIYRTTAVNTVVSYLITRNP